MKKTLTMIVLLFLGNQAIANGLAELKLQAKSNAPLKVFIDGQLVSNNSSHINIKNIPFGNHSLEVFKIHRSHHGYTEKPIYLGNIYLPQNTITNAIVKHNKFIIIEQLALIPIQQNIIYNYQGDNHQTCQPHYEEPELVYEEPIVELFPMNSADFNLLKNAISNEWFSDGKIMVFKHALRNESLFTTNQINEILTLFSFSGDKLEVAKMAYANTLDQDKYYLVFEQLHWNSSKKELNNYIAAL